MPKDKERSVNPAQQQRKLDKAKALKKGKAELQARRNEKLARRNPERMQRQIDDLRALEAKGDIKAREKTMLDELERDLKAVRRAREALGEKAPQYGNRRPPNREGTSGGSVLGKRRHDGQRKPFSTRRESSGSDTDDSVRKIPMPEDTPPPIPREHRRYFKNQEQKENDKPPSMAGEVKATYSAAAQIRDLKKEAINKFVPNIVRRKQEAAGGTGGRLMEPEEMDRLEVEGYVRTDHDRPDQPAAAEGDVAEDDTEAQAIRLAEEEERFRREMEMDGAAPEPALKQVVSRHVQIEDVEDDGD